MRAPTYLITATLLWGSLSGCSVMHSDNGLIRNAVRVDEVLGSDDLGGVDLDYLNIPNYDAIRSTGSFISPIEPSRPLTAAECACMAAAASQVAAALEKEAASLRKQSHKRHSRKNSQLTPGILEDQALEERNDAAGEALEAYYRLAEVQLQESVLAASERELQSTRDTLGGLRRAGIDVDIDPSELDRRGATLILQRAQSQFNRVRLTSQVKSLIGADPLSTWPIQTNCAIEPRPPGFQLQEAIAIGRQNDAQLNTLRKLKDSDRPEDLDLARKLMSVVNPLAGQEASVCFLTKLVALCGGHGSRERKESNLRRNQMADLHDARQQQLDLEIAAAVVNIQEQLVQVGIAKDVRESWEQRVAILESEREVQKSDYLDIINAKSELLRAKSLLYHELILLEIAHAKLKTAMGVLGRECATLGMQPGEPPCSPLHGPHQSTGLRRDQLRR